MINTKSTIRFKTKLFKIGAWTILRLPESASAKLSSRGIVMIEGQIDGRDFKAVLEPDGKGSHWLRADQLASMAKLKVGNTTEVEMSPTQDWIEPEVPADFKRALQANPKENALWKQITPIARWDWIRWVRAAKQKATRQHHIEVAISKLKAGERRPCCFNRSMCTEPSVSDNWVLREIK